MAPGTGRKIAGKRRARGWGKALGLLVAAASKCINIKLHLYVVSVRIVAVVIVVASRWFLCFVLLGRERDRAGGQWDEAEAAGMTVVIKIKGPTRRQQQQRQLLCNFVRFAGQL